MKFRVGSFVATWLRTCPVLARSVTGVVKPALSLLGLLAQLSTLHAQPGAPLAPAQPQPSAWQVLDLDGKDSRVELPGKLFTNEVVTVKGWVKWRVFGFYSRFFEFSDAARTVGLLNSGDSSQLTVQQYRSSTFGEQAQSPLTTTR
jgi:hypothetical protein